MRFLFPGAVTFLVGLWMITVPQPGVCVAQRRDIQPRLVGITLGASVIGGLALAAIEELSPPTPVLVALEVAGLIIRIV